MWQTVDYKGNTVKWYEAELVDAIRKECQKWNYTTIFSVDYGKYLLAKEILDLIKSCEGKDETH
jgi:hypothetical protein